MHITTKPIFCGNSLSLFLKCASYFKLYKCTSTSWPHHFPFRINIYAYIYSFKITFFSSTYTFFSVFCRRSRLYFLFYLLPVWVLWYISADIHDDPYSIYFFQNILMFDILHIFICYFTFLFKISLYITTFFIF